MSEIKRPTKEFVESYLKLKASSQYFGVEPALKMLFQRFPKNSNFDEILLKVTCLNDLYRTKIMGTYRVAEAIQALNIDERLRRGDISLVTEMDATRPNDRSIYSFATKYCSWHNDEAFPIYDQYAGKMLYHYLKVDNEADIYRYELRHYPTYVSKILMLQKKYGLKSIGTKRLDKFLWLYGKENFENNGHNRSSKSTS